MILDDLLIEDLGFMDLHHQFLHTRLVVYVPFALMLLKLRFLVTKLH